MSSGSPEQKNPLFAAKESERSGMPLPVFGIAGAVALLLLAGILLLNKKSSSTSATATLDPYAVNIVISDLQISESTSLSGGKSTYVDGRIHNHGRRTVTAATVQVQFRNDLDLPPQLQTVPLLLVRTREPYTDTQTLGASPLKPGDDREFRLTFESVASNWNQQPPGVRFTQIAVR